MPIYRRGGHTPMNFTLRPADIAGLPYEEQGLSGSDVQETDQVQQEFNDALDNTFNYVDAPVAGNPNHILIRPIGQNQDDVETQMENWSEARAGIAPNVFPPPVNATIPALTTSLNNSWIQTV